jgi:cytochrome d ubiquinol oxidase subunit I
VVDVRPREVLVNHAFPYEFAHMLLAAYVVAGFGVASVYAAGMLRGRRDAYHRRGFLIPFTTASVVLPVQIFVGDVVARHVFHAEPAKFAAIELLPRTSDHVPETLGGIMVDGRVRYGVQVPDAASLLAGFSPGTEIRGLAAIPPAVRPADHLVTIVHLAFDVMVGLSFALLALAIWFAVVWWRRRDVPADRWFLRCASLAGVAAVVTLEAGWVVTEVGRQPWTVVGLLLTRDAVTTSGNVWLFFAAVVVIFMAVAAGAVVVLRLLHHRWQSGAPAAVPYGPPEEGS